MKISNVDNLKIVKTDLEQLKTIDFDCGDEDLNEFLTKFEFPLSLLQTTEGIKNAVKNLQDELLEQGIIYAEIRFAPSKHLEKGLSYNEVVEAAIQGMEKAKRA